MSNKCILERTTTRRVAHSQVMLLDARRGAAVRVSRKVADAAVGEEVGGRRLLRRVTYVCARSCASIAMRTERARRAEQCTHKAPKYCTYERA